MLSGAHLHLILNHLPVVGSLFALVLLGWGIWRRSIELQRAAFGAAVLVALVTIPAYMTGEPAWIDIMDLPGDNDAYILSHESAAQIAFGASALTGVVALIALFLGRKGRSLSAKWPVAVLLLLLATTALMGWVANLGGMIRHTEIRPNGVEQSG